MSDSERELMREHIRYWQGLTEKGISVIFGPVGDPEGAYGLGILETSGLEEVQALADADPTIRSGLGFRYKIAPMRVGGIRSGSSMPG